MGTERERQGVGGVGGLTTETPHVGFLMQASLSLCHKGVETSIHQPVHTD